MDLASALVNATSSAISRDDPGSFRRNLVSYSINYSIVIPSMINHCKRQIIVDYCNWTIVTTEAFHMRESSGFSDPISVEWNTLNLPGASVRMHAHSNFHTPPAMIAASHALCFDGRFRLRNRARIRRFRASQSVGNFPHTHARARCL